MSVRTVPLDTTAVPPFTMIGLSSDRVSAKPFRSTTTFVPALMRMPVSQSASRRTVFPAPAAPIASCAVA